jgi:hypothetical protein
LRDGFTPDPPKRSSSEEPTCFGCPDGCARRRVFAEMAIEGVDGDLGEGDGLL